MITAKKLIILESSDISARYVAEASLKLGFEPIFLCKLNDYQGDTRKQILSYRNFDIDTSDINSLYSFITDNAWEVEGVTSLLDSYMAISCELASKLNCRGIEKAVLQLNDKSRVVELVPEFSPLTMNFDRSSDNLEALKLFLADAPSGIIIKPRFAAGALGFTSISNVIQLTESLETIRNINLPARIFPDLWMAQRKVIGQVMSMEGFVIAGKCTRLGFTASSKVGNTQSKCYFPVDEQMSITAIQTAETAVQSLVDRSHYEHGYFHTEFIVEGPNAVLIDANFGRLGGGGVGEHLALSASVSPVQIFEHYLSATLFGKETISLSHQAMKIKTSAYLYGTQYSTVLEDLQFTDVLNCCHTQILDKGASVPAMGINNWSWIGILTGPSETIDAQLEKIKIKTKNGWERPVC